MTQLEPFDAIYHRACERKGGESVLNSLIAAPLGNKELNNISDDRFLSAFTMKIFQSGFVWRVVRNKWDNFEKEFFQFNIDKILMMPDDMLERKATNPDIIRNLTKVRTIRDNAMMMHDIANEHGSFSSFIANWPSHDITGLWLFLKKNGSRLGGNTGPYGLRAIGKDTFLLSRDVVGYFTSRDIISGAATSKRSLMQIQTAFNQLQETSGRSFQELSQIIAMSVGDDFR